MKTTCEVCGTETKDKVSYLELETWEFDFLKQDQKDFYSICFNCFDTHTNHFIDQEMDLELRKKRSLLVNKEIEEEIEAILEIKM
ncbi:MULTISPECIES: hypothetical protein [Exiguobacterium]|uniref:hypothetical protein n=1 Tax=Exiguobacterium TaxID=33986 RepID=UPI001BEB475A|nr:MULTISPECIES: hypothetical protein [Exiguobacterium]MCT4781987.1 hypothetical protein [Exiguobacterium himgiriensis]